MTFDRGLSIGLFFFSTLALYFSITMPTTAIRQTVGPQLFPMGIALCLMAASVALFFRTMRVAEDRAGAGELPEGVEREDRATQAAMLAGVAVYIFLLEPLGYIVATGLLCIYEAFVFDPSHRLRNILSGAAFSVGVYAIFVNVLDILLPKGILGW